MKFETGFYWMQFSCLSLSHYEASNLLCPGKFTYLDEHVPVLVFCYLPLVHHLWTSSFRNIPVDVAIYPVA